MEKKEINDFSWSVLFIVTACCSFLFSGILKLLDGDFSWLLLVIGGVAAGMAAVNWVGRMIDGYIHKKRKDPLVS
jgi:hypothetical protein